MSFSVFSLKSILKLGLESSGSSQAAGGRTLRTHCVILARTGHDDGLLGPPGPWKPRLGGPSCASGLSVSPSAGRKSPLGSQEAPWGVPGQLRGRRSAPRERAATEGSSCPCTVPAASGLGSVAHIESGGSSASSLALPPTSYRDRQKIVFCKDASIIR